MPGLGLLNLGIALRHFTSSVYLLRREREQLPAIVGSCTRAEMTNDKLQVAALAIAGIPDSDFQVSSDSATPRTFAGHDRRP